MDINEALKNVLSFFNGTYNGQLDVLWESARLARSSNLKELRDIVTYLYYKRLNEVNTFLNVIKYPNKNPLFDSFLYSSYLPFKDSKDANVEAILFGFDIQVGKYFFAELFKKFMNENDIKLYGDKISNYTHYVGLNLYTITTIKFQGHKDNIFPKDDNDIYLGVCQAFNNYHGNIYGARDNVATGHFAELVIYNYLKSNPNLDVVWISRYVGDGYGYDMITYNKQTGEIGLVEVKGTLNVSNEMVHLTNNEMNMLQTITDSNIKYIMYKVIIAPGENIIHQYIGDSSGDIIYIDPVGKLGEVIKTYSLNNYDLYLEPKKLEKKLDGKFDGN